MPNTREAVEACSSMDYIKYNVSQIARRFGLDLARGSTEAAQAGTNLKPAFGPEKNKAAIPCFTLRRFSESLHTTGCRSVRGRAAFMIGAPQKKPPP
ncbi:MAG: hypothetical protein ACLTZY_00210 [Alistipes indistinctus]